MKKTISSLIVFIFLIGLFAPISINPLIKNEGLFTKNIINADEIQPVTPKKDDTKSDIYTLLAPIGTFKVATDNIGDYFNKIFIIAIGLCGVLAVIMIVIGGVQYMGDESVFGKTDAKDRIKNAILGLFIALGSFALLNTINPELLGGGGVNIIAVSADIDEETAPWTEYESGDSITGCPSGFMDVNVNGGNPSKINVCRSIAGKLMNLINAAKANNPSISLSGYGSRKTSKQQALRVQNNCADPKIPSTSCHPNAVARPGFSNHEKGLAVDFTCNGKSMLSDKTNTNNICYKWLVANASEFGFKNDFDTLKETWHWSTTGR